MAEITTVPETLPSGAFVPKLFEHERRIAVVEKDIERQSETLAALTKEIYVLPATFRDIMDAKVSAVSMDANIKFDKLSDKLGKLTWYAFAGMVALVADVIVHFLPHF
jgi:hypothetical protein